MFISQPKTSKTTYKLHIRPYSYFSKEQNWIPFFPWKCNCNLFMQAQPKTTNITTLVKKNLTTLAKNIFTKSWISVFCIFLNQYWQEIGNRSPETDCFELVSVFVSVFYLCFLSLLPLLFLLSLFSFFVFLLSFRFCFFFLCFLSLFSFCACVFVFSFRISFVSLSYWCLLYL